MEPHYEISLGWMEAAGSQPSAVTPRWIGKAHTEGMPGVSGVSSGLPSCNDHTHTSTYLRRNIKP